MTLHGVLLDTRTLLRAARAEGPLWASYRRKTPRLKAETAAGDKLGHVTTITTKHDLFDPSAYNSIISNIFSVLILTGDFLAESQAVMSS